MLEDILRDLRNNTKEVELKETSLFELVPLYRTNYAQPAFDHVEGMKQHARYLERLLITINGSESFAAVTAYQRITEGFNKAFELAADANKFSKESSLKVNISFIVYSYIHIMQKIVMKSCNLLLD